MADDPSSATPDESQRAFDRIWTQLPERQNRTSSSWWFFILFPEGEEGYGPRQLMFSVAARVGDRCSVNGVEAPGMDLDRHVEDGVDRFNAASVGWCGDADRVHEYVVNQPAKATLSTEGFLEAWTEGDDGERRGSEIRASSNHPMGLEAHFVGDDAEARFEAWGDLDSRVSSPDHSTDIQTPLGGTDLVALRRMNFEGEFELPDGQETLEGLCYFQRVCLNIPLFPWKWIWALFPDGTAFSAMVSFVGPQLFRRGYGFSSSETLERATVPLRKSALWDWGSGENLVEFDRASITPVLNSGAHPDFEVEVRNDRGDYVSFLASSYGHARNYIDRPILGGRTDSHWSYNEYMFRMANLEGRVDGTLVGDERMGQGFGTLEYTWGLGL
jgi:hypothetical protein